MDTDNGFQIGIDHRVVVTATKSHCEKKIPIGLAVRIDLLKKL